jgi:large subunit ribosomal protein L4
MTINVLTESGKKTTKSVKLSAKVFDVKPHDHAIWLDIRSIRANQRQGTHDTKGRSQVSGGGRKPFRQKGTGRARQGTIRAPQYVGGGTVFGPHPRKYKVGINKKVKIIARKSALSYKAQSEDIIVVEDFSFDTPKTKRFYQFLEALDVDKKNILFLTSAIESNINLSARNLHKVNIQPSVSFSTYDVLRAEKLIFQESALKKINEVYG